MSRRNYLAEAIACRQAKAQRAADLAVAREAVIAAAKEWIRTPANPRSREDDRPLIRAVQDLNALEATNE